MAGSEVYRVEIPIIVDDQTEPPLQQAERKINRFEKSAQKTNERLRRIFGREIRLRIGAVDKAWPIIRSVQTRLRGLTARAWNITVGVKDRVSGFLSRVGGMLMGPLALLGAGAGIYGLGRLTIGAAAQFEQYTVSMEHWLKGNRKLAQETMRWVEEFSDITPFTPEQLFPAMARAVNIEKGMVEPAKRLVKLSGEMAALTPGKTVLDAMEALADAQVGEFERMKEFGMKISQEQYKAMGGWVGFLEEAENKFAGGMKRLSRSAVGLSSTILGRILTLFRSAGIGMLEAIKPRLEKIVDWFDENKKVVERWKNSLIRWGRDAFEGILSWGERALSKLEDILEREDFKEADITGKISILIEEGMPELTKKATELGKVMGKNIAKGLYEAIKEDPWLGILLGAYVGFRIAGPKGAAIGAGIGAATWGIPKGFEALGKHIPGSSYYTQERLAEYERAKQMLEERRAVTPPGEPLFPGTELRAMPKRAAGGIYSRPHTALIAEAGPEAIIPLSARMRGRALGLWEETGRRLGIGITAPALAGAGGPSISVTNYIDVSVAGSNADPDEIAEAIAVRLERLYHNMPRK